MNAKPFVSRFRIPGSETLYTEVHLAGERFFVQVVQDNAKERVTVDIFFHTFKFKEDAEAFARGVAIARVIVPQIEIGDHA